ncbi:MAG TPA: FAD synthetase family protein, partial [Candidatus Binatus sp.]|nr:FAD synthetase family protein [Candidatus Binatus sp.]
RLFLVLGVFDGLHRGHLYLLAALRRAAEERGARPAVITFDHHPDEVLTGSAPPLLCDAEERLERLAEAGVAITVVHHFDLATRRTPYDGFVRQIIDRVELAGFLMTPESAFGFERRGTPDAVATLGRELGYDVVVVPTLELDGQPVRSAEIRAEIARGDLAAAAELLGRPYAIVGSGTGGAQLRFGMPVALPADGTYPVSVDDVRTTVTIADGRVRVDDGVARHGRTRVVFD